MRSGNERVVNVIAQEVSQFLAVILIPHYDELKFFETPWMEQHLNKVLYVTL